jgi:hypothetical protein
MDIGSVGSRRIAILIKALNSFDSGQGSNMPERNQPGIPLFGGTGLDCTWRISWWISR